MNEKQKVNHKTGSFKKFVKTNNLPITMTTCRLGRSREDSETIWMAKCVGYLFRFGLHFNSHESSFAHPDSVNHS